MTDLLSSFLEFDPEQLQLGIWSGDLSIKNVELKKDAVYPLLNGTSLPQKEGKPPLNLMLVSGSVGHMRIQIPWKRMVWGQGDVRLQISDVTIAVAYESREETAARKSPKEEKAIFQEVENGDEEDKEKREARERKQEWLREAERCQLQGHPIPTEPKLDLSAKEEAIGDEASVVRSAGILDRWINNWADSFAWRFFAGLQASIRNVRVVIMQDGVEIGAIFHSMDVHAGNQNGTEKSSQETEPTYDEGTGGVTTVTPPPDVIPEGEYDDGEHVDKTIIIKGFGFFIRREGRKNPKIPPALKFSASVTADDYLLRPTEGALSFSFFQPYPVGKKGKKRQQITEQEPTTPTTATASTDTGSLTSSKARRSKREKRMISKNEAVADSPGKERPAKQPQSDRRVSLPSTEFQSAANLLPIPATPVTGNRLKSHTMDCSNLTAGREQQRAPTNVPGPPSRCTSAASAQLIRRPSTVSVRCTSIPLLRADDASTMPPPTSERESLSPKPRLDLSLSFGDVKTRFSSRHYELGLLFNAIVERMKNGRPRKTIASCFGEQGPDTMRLVYVDAGDVERAMASQRPSEVQPPPPSGQIDFATPESRHSSVYADATIPHEDVGESAIVPALPKDPQSSARPAGLDRRAQTTGQVDFRTPGEKPQRVQLYLQLQLPKEGDKYSEVVRSWWHYAYSAILFEVRQRRIEQAIFEGKDLQFDWERQSYRRKEYVELYIATQLEPSSIFRSRAAHEKLLDIEDELSVEQIILYRAIARSLRVRGMRKMPNSIRELHGDHWLEATPVRHGHVPNRVSGSPGVSCRVSMDFEKERNDLDDIRWKANAVRRRRLIGDESEAGKNVEEKQRAEHTNDSTKSEVVVATPFYDSRTDGRTARSFHTARTNFRSRMSASTDAKERDKRSVALRISVSVSFSNIELLVCRERQNSVGSVNSMGFRTKKSDGQLDSKIRSSSGLQLVVDDASGSEFSDLSILSDDQIFFDQYADIPNAPEDESLGDDPVMSSADFLLFGSPENVLLHATVSGLTIKSRGHSGGSNISSLTIDHILVNGDDGCHLLSLIPYGDKPVDEVIVEKPKKPATKSMPSFTEMGILQGQAVFVSLVKKQLGAQLQCDLSKVKATINVQAAVKLVDFFADIRVTSPHPSIARTPVHELRAYVMRRLALGKERRIDLSESISRALRIHGVELIMPCPDERDSLSRGAQAEVKISMNLVECYDGSFVDDVCALSNDFSEDMSRLTEGTMSMVGNMGWQRRHLNMLDVSEIITAQQAFPLRRSVRLLSRWRELFSCLSDFVLSYV